MKSKQLQCIAIDDDPLFLLKIESFVEEIEWIDLVGKFTSPVEAASDIIAKKPDLLFLDIEMPYINGYQLIDWIDPYLKKIEPRPKVIIITGKKELLNTGFDKPILARIFKSDLNGSEDLVKVIPRDLHG